MIEVKFVGDQCITRAHGDYLDLCCDLSLVICAIYADLKQKDEETAEMFRALLIDRVNDPTSLFWVDIEDQDKKRAVITAFPGKGGIPQ